MRPRDRLPPTRPIGLGGDDPGWERSGLRDMERRACHCSSLAFHARGAGRPVRCHLTIVRRGQAGPSRLTASADRFLHPVLRGESWPRERTTGASGTSRTTACEGDRGGASSVLEAPPAFPNPGRGIGLWDPRTADCGNRERAASWRFGGRSAASGPAAHGGRPAVLAVQASPRALNAAGVAGARRPAAMLGPGGRERGPSGARPFLAARPASAAIGHRQRSRMTS
jgi:hypothetical protein